MAKTTKIPDLVATTLLALLNRNVTALYLEIATADTKAQRKRDKKAATAFRLGRNGALLDLARELGLTLPEPTADPLAELRVGMVAVAFDKDAALRDVSKYNSSTNIPLS